jgi:hypothetical protein
MIRPSIIAAALLTSTMATAQTYTCTMLQHWRNSAINGDFIPDSVEVLETHNVITIDLRAGIIRNGNLPVVKGSPVHVAGAASIGMLSGGSRELTIHAIFPNIKVPDGGVLGSIMRLQDNDYMPKGTLMTRMSCKPS